MTLQSEVAFKESLRLDFCFVFVFVFCLIGWSKIRTNHPYVSRHKHFADSVASLGLQAVCLTSAMAMEVK